jgi:hypothetical protein
MIHYHTKGVTKTKLLGYLGSGMMVSGVIIASFIIGYSSIIVPLAIFIALLLARGVGIIGISQKTTNHA